MCNSPKNLVKINEWCYNKLPLNASKCNVMTYSNKINVTNFNYSLENILLKRPETFQDLGGTFDQKLAFTDYISNLTSDSFKALGFIIRNSAGFISISTLVALLCICKVTT